MTYLLVKSLLNIQPSLKMLHFLLGSEAHFEGVFIFFVSLTDFWLLTFSHSC